MYQSWFNASLVSVMTLLLLTFSSLGNSKSLPDFTALIEKHAPAVVKIETITRSTNAQQQSPQAIPENIPEIFRHLFEQQQRRAPQAREGRAMGSGFFISSDGFIITNNHVVEGATEILVRLTDRREFDAKIIGLDPQSDLALLKVESKKRLPYLKLANSDKAKVGEWVLAIGSPFGLDYSVSAGIISAIGRSLPSGGQQNYVPFIQTDVAINPGNSGGPLFNLNGEVVGINSQIYTNSGGSIGLSFAIPSNLAQNVVEQLKETGTVNRGWLGVVIQDVGKDLALSFGLSRPQGALIAQLDEQGPGALSGLKVGDVIIAFNGRKVESSSDLPHIVGPIKPGTSVIAEVMRKGKKIGLEITVGTRDKDGTVVSQAEEIQPKSTRLGVELQELPSEIRETLGSGGVAVLAVGEDSAASKAGLQRGDIIVQLGFDDIASIADYERIEAALPSGKPQPIRVIRQGSSLFRSVIIED